MRKWLKGKNQNRSVARSPTAFAVPGSGAFVKSPGENQPLWFVEALSPRQHSGRPVTAH